MASKDFHQQMGKGARLVYANAPPCLSKQGKIITHQYGVAVVIHNPLYKITPIASSRLGMVALTVIAPDAEKFLLIAIYLPPLKGKKSKKVRRKILQLAAAVWARERRHHHGGGVIGGDINAQPGKTDDRIPHPKATVTSKVIQGSIFYTIKT